LETAVKSLEGLEKIVPPSGTYWYIATPYSKYAGGMLAAFHEAIEFTADLMRAGSPAFSPIAHSHPVATHGALPHDHNFWMKMDLPLLKGAHGLIVYMMDGWDRSLGVDTEIDFAFNQRLPVLWIEPVTYRIHTERPE
jgi:hypothetical protein